MTRSSLTLVTYRNKAVALGALSFYVDHFVIGRVSKFTYGTPCAVFYRPSDPEHVKREHMSYLNVAGNKVLSGSFVIMLPRVRQSLPLITDAPRQFHRITGHQGSGGSRSPPQLLLHIRWQPRAMVIQNNRQVHWHT